MHLLLCVLAALCFTVGGLFMKYADGFRHPPAGVAFLLLFGLGAVLQSHAMRNEGLAVTYVLVLGLEAAFAVAFGLFLLGEAVSLVKLAGVAVTVAGIALLRGL
jgi:multidrug transporter EmrE-like cation transporter